MLKLTQQQINYIVVTICALIAFIFSLKTITWFCFGAIALLIGDDIFKYSSQIKEFCLRIYSFVRLIYVLWPSSSFDKIWRATQKNT
jgi:hypothetical protein